MFLSVFKRLNPTEKRMNLDVGVGSVTMAKVKVNPSLLLIEHTPPMIPGDL